MMLAALALAAAVSSTTPNPAMVLAGTAYAVGDRTEWEYRDNDNHVDEFHGGYVYSNQKSETGDVSISGNCFSVGGGAPFFAFVGKGSSALLEDSPVLVGSDLGGKHGMGQVMEPAGVKPYADSPDEVNVAILFKDIDKTNERLYQESKSEHVGFDLKDTWAIWGFVNLKNDQAAYFSIPIYNEVPLSAIKACFK